jgi:uncharacterized membrane protein
MESLLQLIGRFHPVLVHLPIGFLILGILMVFYPKREGREMLPAIQLAFFWGSIAAILAVVTGILLYLQEGYSFDTVNKHLILGILTALLSLGCYFLLKKNSGEINRKLKVATAGLMLMLLVTGHLGGELTHGEEYFTEVLPEGLQAFFGSQPVAAASIVLDRDNWEAEVLYDAVIHPILTQNCNSCHNPKNKKGDLVLSSPETIGRGGKGGMVIDKNLPEHSALLTRMLLPLEDKEHMPPKGKRQPSKEEITLIRMWLDSGASFEMQMHTAGITEQMIERYFPKEQDDLYPNIDIPKWDQGKVAELKASGLLVEPISQGSNFLKVSLINRSKDQPFNLETLFPLAVNIAVLDLSAAKLDDRIWADLIQFENLAILKLNHVPINGAGIAELNKLKQLKRLYLNYSTIQLDSLVALSEHVSLQGIYFFGTPAAVEAAAVGPKFLAKLVYEPYDLPALPSDDILY